MLTFCRSNTGVFPTSQVSYSFHIVTFSSAQMDDTPLLFDRQRCLLKILQFLMNMDKQL